jgi:hypothetical protein
VIVLDSDGKPVSTISGPQIAGPWDMTSTTQGTVTTTVCAHDGGTTLSIGGNLKQPLGLIVAPDGDILTTKLPMQLRVTPPLSAFREADSGQLAYVHPRN